MTQKYLEVWLSIEKEIGGCCLHKKAAFNYASGKPIDVLSLATCAATERIENFIGEKEVEKTQKVYKFLCDGVPVELTYLTDIKNINELCEKSFRSFLTVDSLGVRSDGLFNDRYGGLNDLRNKIIRFSNNGVILKDNLLKHIFDLIINDGYTLDDSVKKYFSDKKIFDNDNFRKRLFECIANTVRDKKSDWHKISGFLNEICLPKNLSSELLSYTSKLKESKDNLRFTNAYLVLMFFLFDAKPQEISMLFKDYSLLEYYEDIRQNINLRINSYNDYTDLKDKYGAEITDMFFDIQEIYFAVIGSEYKRPSEKDFDLMLMMMEDDSFWVDGSSMGEDVCETQKKIDIDGSFDFEAAVSGEYKEELYADILPQDKTNKETTPKKVKKKDICIDDVISEKENNGIDINAIDNYEKEVFGKNTANEVL